MNQRKCMLVGMIILVVLVLLYTAQAMAQEPDFDHFVFLPMVMSVVCDCSGNIYNCADFPTQQHAQVCFDYCMVQGYGDVHYLDADGDGVACENLPRPTPTPTKMPTITFTPTSTPGSIVLPTPHATLTPALP